MDPVGHMESWPFKDVIWRDNSKHRQTTTVVTMAGSKELRTGDSVPDGSVCLNALGELRMAKFAVMLGWYIPGNTERSTIDMYLEIML